MTTYGFDVVEFADEVLHEPLDEWQRWAIIHAGELLPDGRPRFRTVLILVARQNGKTHLLRVLMLFWLFVEEWPVILGMSTDRSYAKRTLHAVHNTARSIPELKSLLPQKRNLGLTGMIGEESITTAAGCEYLIAATNRRAGRSLTIDRLFIDEIREHRNREAWDACTNAMNARPYGQTFCISNQGDDQSVLLDSLHEDVLKAIDEGDEEYRTGLFEWSAPAGADLLDVNAVAQANPNLNRRVLFDNIKDELARAKRNGGLEEASARTEIMCQRVHSMNSAVDPTAWTNCKDPGDLSQVRNRVALVLDVAPDGLHATLTAAAVLGDGRVRVENIRAWSDVKTARAELTPILQKVKPQAFGWFPSGPAASMAAELKVRPGWPGPGIAVSEIRGDTAAVCMGFADIVKAEQLAHSDDPLLNDHIGNAEKLYRGDTWVFSRKGSGHCDAAYAAAGAVHLARTLPPALGKPRLVVVEDD